jgi:2-polyprenyl-3-methyl-5-hydroxy-6-metoxy-1,4-benzoquinol methylase
MKNYINSYYGGRINSKIFGDNNFSIFYCRDCDFYWQGSILIDKYLSLLYSSWIDKFESFTKHNNKKNLLDRLNILSFLSRCINSQMDLRNRNDIKFLDFGGGWGDFATCAKALGCDVFLYELSSDRVDYAISQGIVCINNSQLINYKNSFDFILLNQVLEHVPYPKKFLDEIYLLLKPGGIMFVSVPNANVFSNYIEKGPFQPLEHINCFTPKSLRLLVENANFTIINSNPVFTKITIKNLLLNLLRKFIYKALDNQKITYATSYLCKKID